MTYTDARRKDMSSSIVRLVLFVGVSFAFGGAMNTFESGYFNLARTGPATIDSSDPEILFEV